MVLDNLEPKDVFYYFEEISSIPHGSGNTLAISNYCVDFAKTHGLKYSQDKFNNLIIYKPATVGYETSPTIILQGHLDMVCAKESSSNKDFLTDGLDIFIDGEFIGARETSLGGDDGIAIAICLALLASNNISHPKIEVVFTVDEETGMSGAKGLDTSVLSGKLMLNLDSEEEGVFTVACAGGARVQHLFNISSEICYCVPLQILISGLIGGHSGTEICKGRENANVLMTTVLCKMQNYQSFRLISLHGGEADNAIANSCSANISVSALELSEFLSSLEEVEKELRNSIGLKEPNFIIGHSYDAEQHINCFTKECTKQIIAALSEHPNGVQKMSQNAPTLPETSLNFGMLETTSNYVLATYSVRSSIRKEKECLIDRICSISQKYNGSSRISGEYPAWEYLPSSSLRPLMYNTYISLFHKEPSIVEIHAGLECGILAEKIAGLDCVSFGPDILNIHTARERLSIDSVSRTWDFLKLILSNIKE